MAGITYTKANGLRTVEMTLLSGATGTTDGEWLPLMGYQPATVQIDGITSATVELRGSNAPTKPLNTAAGFLLKSFTSDGAAEVLDPVKWVKVRIITYASGTISAWGIGHQGAQRLP